MLMCGMMAAALPLSTAANAQQADSGQPALSNGQIETLKTGLLEQINPEAIASLELAASQGSGNALLALGDVYSRSIAVEADGAKAADYYRAAIDAGNKAALNRLADLYREGRLVPADPAAAAALYEQSITNGDSWARFRLGSALVNGALGAVDVERGLALLEESRAQGNPKAGPELGQIWLLGLGGVEADPVRALALFSEAADAGDVASRLQVARMLLTPQTDLTNIAGGIAAYEAAVEDEVPGAAFELARAYLETGPGKMRSTRKGIQVLKVAVAAGDGRATVAYANRMIWGKGGLKQNPAAAVAMLEKAAEAGDGFAARALVDTWRDGRGKHVSKSLRKAKKAMERYATAIGPRDMARFELLILAAQANDTGKWSQVSAKLLELDPRDIPGAFMNLRVTSPNAYVYAVQELAQRKDVTWTSRNGLMTRNTISAVNMLCALAGEPEAAIAGPMSAEAARAMSKLF